MSNKISILSTKRISSIQKQQLLASGFEVIEKDFIETESKAFNSDNTNQNLIFTSPNAVRSVLLHPKIDQLKSKPVFCVGLKTKEMLTENGFNVSADTDYAYDLAQIISLVYNRESYTFFCGNLRRDILPDTLKQNNIVFNEVQVYETKLIPQKINEKPDGIMFFSPSAVMSYLEKNKITNEICFCIGETTAEALESREINNIVIAERPSVENVITEVTEFYNK